MVVRDPVILKWFQSGIPASISTLLGLSLLSLSPPFPVLRFLERNNSLAGKFAEGWKLRVLYLSPKYDLTNLNLSIMSRHEILRAQIRVGAAAGGAGLSAGGVRADLWPEAGWQERVDRPFHGG